MGWPRTLRAGTAEAGNLQITNLCFAIFIRSRQCSTFPPESLSLPFFQRATLSTTLVLLQSAGDTSPAARRHDKIPEESPTRRHQQPRTVIGNTIYGRLLRAAATNDPRYRNVKRDGHLAATSVAPVSRRITNLVHQYGILSS